MDCEKNYKPCEGIAPWVPGFIGWNEFTSTIPKLYWDVESQEQRIKNICLQLHKLCCYADMLGCKININRSDIDKLIDDFNKFKEHGLDDYYLEQVKKWIDEHLNYIFTHVAKQVFFGLTLDGHFCAYIPDSWSDIEFDTGAVYGRTDYGRLILRFQADGAIDNTYSYTVSELKSFEKFRGDFESEIKRIDASFDTLFTNMDKDVVLNGDI